MADNASTIENQRDGSQSPQTSDPFSALSTGSYTDPDLEPAPLGAQDLGGFSASEFVDDGATIQRFGKQEDEEISQKYDVGEQVGRGGCAVVLEAWRKTDRMHVVIKILQVSTGYDSHEAKVAVKRFYREAELIAALTDEHIVRCIDYGRYQGTPCMVLEFIEGLPLDKMLQNYGALPLPYATGIIQQLLGALVETHEKNIIHRDIKPSNIMVFDTPPPYDIRVLDFGISTVLDNLQSQTLMTQQGNVRGTPSYMAPELFTGDTRASVESDLYAVGLVYLECLTGEIAVNDKSFMRVAYKQVNEELDIPLFIPKGIADIIHRLCKKKIEDRYHSAQDVLRDIEAHLPQAIKDEEKCLKAYQKELNRNGGKPKSRSSVQLQQTTAQWQNKTVFGIILMVIVILMGLVVWIVSMMSETTPAEPVSEPQNVAPVVPEKTAEELNAEQLALTKRDIQNASEYFESAWYIALKAADNYKEQKEEEVQPEKKKAKPKRSKKGLQGGKIVDPIQDLPF